MWAEAVRQVRAEASAAESASTQASLQERTVQLAILTEAIEAIQPTNNAAAAASADDDDGRLGE